MLYGTFGLSDLILLVKGAGVTLYITGWSVFIGTVTGVVLGVIRAEGTRILNVMIGMFLDVFKSVPVLIQLVLANSLNSIFKTGMGTFQIACLVLALYTAAYCAEIVRAGLLAVPAVTRNAARSLGMTYFQSLRDIAFPIAIKVMLPSWIGLTLGVMKDTSLVLWVGIVELLRTSQSIVTRTQEPLLVLAMTGLIYFLLSYPIARVGMELERRWKSDDRAQ